MSDWLLAIDTATEIASVAVGTPQHVAAVVSVRGARSQSAQIIELVDRALGLAAGAGKAGMGALSGIIVGDGPGSFTGLRIGWAAAKGLAHERGLPLSAVPSLMGAAAGAAAWGAIAGPIGVCFDALRGQVYGAVYEFPADRVVTLVAPDVLTVPELAHLAPPPARPRVVVGDGAVRYAADVVAWTGAPPVGLEALPSVAASLLVLVPRAGAVRAIPDPHTAEPTYGRPADAQTKWEARHGRPLPDPSRSAQRRP